MIATNLISSVIIQVSPEDNHKRICTMCDKKLREWWDFKLEVQSAQKFLNLQKQLYSKTVTSSGENVSNCRIFLSFIIPYLHFSFYIQRSHFYIALWRVLRRPNCHSIFSSHSPLWGHHFILIIGIN